MPKPPFVHPGMRLPFALLVTCFAAWGIAANMTDPLVQVFSRIFSMSTTRKHVSGSRPCFATATCSTAPFSIR